MRVVRSGVAIPARGSAVVTSGTHSRLHLVLGLDMVQQATGGEDLVRLQNIRDVFPGVMVTICTERPFHEVAGLFPLEGFFWPDHLWTDGFSSLHHRMAGNVLERDEECEEIAFLPREERDDPHRLATAGLAILEAGWNAPRPLMVACRPPLGSALLELADVPVVDLAAPLGETSHATALHPDVLEGHDLSEVIRLVMACLLQEESRTPRGSVRQKMDRRMGGGLLEGHVEPNPPAA